MRELACSETHHTVREVSDRAWTWLEAHRDCACAGRREQYGHPGGIGDALYEKLWPIFEEAVLSGAGAGVVVAVFKRVARDVRERLCFRLDQ